MLSYAFKGFLWADILLFSYLQVNISIVEHIKALLSIVDYQKLT
jgi:hypothetical protein